MVVGVVVGMGVGWGGPVHDQPAEREEERDPERVQIGLRVRWLGWACG